MKAEEDVPNRLAQPGCLSHVLAAVLLFSTPRTSWFRKPKSESWDRSSRWGLVWKQDTSWLVQQILVLRTLDATST